MRATSPTFTDKLKSKISSVLSLDTKGTLAAPDAAMLALFGATPSVTGASVTPASAMGVPAVQAAVTLISDTVGTLPAKTFMRTEEGKEPNPDHPSFSVVHDDANPWTSAGALRGQLTMDSLLTGNGYAFCVRANGRVKEFIRLDPSNVKPQINSDGEPVYAVKQGKTTSNYPFIDILHITAPVVSSDGVTGIAPIYLCREAIALSIVLETHAARLFGRGARPSGVLKFQKKLDPETVTRIGTSWNAAHAGDAAGKTAILEDGGDFQALSFSSVDAEFAAMRSFQIHEIARAFRVAPVFLMELDRATYSNAEEMNRSFLQYTILPWLRTWEAAYRRVLLSQDERADHSIEFILDDLLRADTATRSESYSKGRAGGWLTANEVRKFENLPAIAGGDKLENPYTTAPAKAAKK